MQRNTSLSNKEIFEIFQKIIIVKYYLNKYKVKIGQGKIIIKKDVE